MVLFLKLFTALIISVFAGFWCFRNLPSLKASYMRFATVLVYQAAWCVLMQVIFGEGILLVALSFMWLIAYAGYEIKNSDNYARMERTNNMYKALRAHDIPLPARARAVLLWESFWSKG